MSRNGITTIGVCSDTHFWRTDEPVVTSDGSMQLQPWSVELLNELVNSLREQKVDLVLHLGDQTCGGGTFGMTPDEFLAELDYLREAYLSMGIPFYPLPGNHDSLPVVGGWTDFERIWELEPGIGQTIDAPNARLVLLNTHGHNQGQIDTAQDGDPVYGWVNDAELARLEEALATAGDRPVLIFCHQLLKCWSNGQGWRAFYEVRNGPGVLAVMERYGNVRAVFQGHAHRFDVQAMPMAGRECTYVVLPSLIEYPLAWLRLDISKDNVRMRLIRLPLADLANKSRASGAGQSWRAGRPEWWDHVIPLAS